MKAKNLMNYARGGALNCATLIFVEVDDNGQPIVTDACYISGATDINVLNGINTIDRQALQPQIDKHLMK